MDLMKALTSQYMKEELPQMNVGDTVRVHVKIKEGARERVQVFEGTIIARKHGGIEESITVRRLSYGVGCEKVFPVHSPSIVKVETVRRGKVRRAKLYYLRNRLGKAAKVKGEGLSLSAKTSPGSPGEVCIFRPVYGLAAQGIQWQGVVFYAVRMAHHQQHAVFPAAVKRRLVSKAADGARGTGNILSAAQGDLEARNVLIERNLRLVAHIMKKYYTQTSDQEDLISIGTIGLIKGISTFDPKKGARLATYAARCVENAIHPPGRHFPFRLTKRDRCASSDPVFKFQKAQKAWHPAAQPAPPASAPAQAAVPQAERHAPAPRGAPEAPPAGPAGARECEAPLPYDPPAGILCRGGGAYSGSFATSSSSASPSASSNVGCGRMAASSWRAVMPLAMA